MAGRSFAATLRRSARGSASTRGPPKAAPCVFSPSQRAALLMISSVSSIAFLRGRAPGEQPVTAEHDALHVRIGFGHRAELEPKVEARPLPGQKAKLAAIDLFRERFRVFARGDRNDRVRMNVIDMAVRNEAVQRCVDRGRARIEVEGAMVVERDHLILVLEAAIDRLEAEELVEIERRETVELHRTDVAAGAL